MKRAFIAILLFYVCVQILLPYGFYSVFGYSSVYSDIRDQTSLDLAFGINVWSIVLTLLVIWFIPDRRKPLRLNVESAVPVYVLSLGVFLASYYSTNGFSGAITGDQNGTVLSYLSRFLSPLILLTVILGMQKKPANLLIVLLSFVAVRTITGSRSAIVSLIVLLVWLPAFANYQRYKSTMWRLMIAMAFATPLLFVYATTERGSSGTISTLDSLKTSIVGRVSYLESAMLPIHFKDNPTPDTALFYQKYDLNNQVKQILNSTVVLRFFGQDVNPNQYFRSAFLGMPEATAKQYYTSINMTLPAYYYMYFGAIGSVFVTVATLVVLYLMVIMLRSTVLRTVLIVTLYQILTYFDWVMVATTVENYLLTFALIFLVDKLVPKLRFRQPNKILPTE